jgi:hypothetical protein
MTVTPASSLKKRAKKFFIAPYPRKPNCEAATTAPGVDDLPIDVACGLSQPLKLSCILGAILRGPVLVAGNCALTTLAGLLTVLAVASPNAAEISVDNSLSSEAAGGPVALHHITVTIYKSRTVPFEKPFTKAIVGSNEIVDVLPISDRTLYLQGKKLGTTNVTVFDADGRLLSILDVEVAIDIGEIQQKNSAQHRH